MARCIDKGCTGSQKSGHTAGRGGRLRCAAMGALGQANGCVHLLSDGLQHPPPDRCGPAAENPWEANLFYVPTQVRPVPSVAIVQPKALTLLPRAEDLTLFGRTPCLVPCQEPWPSLCAGILVQQQHQHPTAAGELHTYSSCRHRRASASSWWHALRHADLQLTRTRLPVTLLLPPLRPLLRAGGVP